MLSKEEHIALTIFMKPEQELEPLKPAKSRHCFTYRFMFRSACSIAQERQHRKFIL